MRQHSQTQASKVIKQAKASLSEHLFMERVIFMRGCLRGDNGGSHEAHYSCNSDHGVDCCARFCARHKLYGLDLEAGRDFLLNDTRDTDNQANEKTCDEPQEDASRKAHEFQSPNDRLWWFINRRWREQGRYNAQVAVAWSGVTLRERAAEICGSFFFNWFRSYSFEDKTAIATIDVSPASSSQFSSVNPNMMRSSGEAMT